MEPLIGCKDPLDLHGFLSKPHETLITTTCEGKSGCQSSLCERTRRAWRSGVAGASGESRGAGGALCAVAGYAWVTCLSLRTWGPGETWPSTTCGCGRRTGEMMDLELQDLKITNPPRMMFVSVYITWTKTTNAWLAWSSWESWSS